MRDQEAMFTHTISRRVLIKGLAAGMITIISSGCAASNPSPTATPNESPTRVQISPTPSHSQALYTYHGHTEAVGSVDWSPRGQRIASASADSTVQIWDAATGGHVLTYEGHSGEVNTVAWSPDGQYLASGGVDQSVQV